MITRDTIRRLYRQFHPSTWVLFLAITVAALYYAVPTVSDFISGFQAGRRDAALERQIGTKITESIEHEAKADEAVIDRKVQERELERLQPARQAAEAEVNTARVRSIETKRRYEESKKPRHRVDTPLDERERDVLATDRQLYPDANR